MNNNLGKLNFFEMKRIQPIEGGVSFSINSEETNVKSFKDVVSDMMKEINEVANKPEQMTAAAMQGKADIHDVMTAVAQSEITVQAATTITGKILQTYEKIMQIQI